MTENQHDQPSEGDAPSIEPRRISFDLSRDTLEALESPEFEAISAQISAVMGQEMRHHLENVIFSGMVPHEFWVDRRNAELRPSMGWQTRYKSQPGHAPTIEPVDNRIVLFRICDPIENVDPVYYQGELVEIIEIYDSWDEWATIKAERGIYGAYCDDLTRKTGFKHRMEPYKALMFK